MKHALLRKRVLQIAAKSVLLLLPLGQAIAFASETKCEVTLAGTIEKANVLGKRRIVGEWTRSMCSFGRMNVSPSLTSTKSIFSCGFDFKESFYRADIATSWRDDGQYDLDFYYRKGTLDDVYGDPRPSDRKSSIVVTPGENFGITVDIVNGGIFDRPAKRTEMLLKKVTLECETSNPTEALNKERP